MEDLSRRPHTAPNKTPLPVEEALLKLRELHPGWGARKLRHALLEAGHSGVPSPSTVISILRRRGAMRADRAGPAPWQRFEHPSPNDLWQMDFKGHFQAGAGRCHPLTVLDDHSRYALCVKALANEKGVSVKDTLSHVFERYGMPYAILCDNGSPWGSDSEHGLTPLGVWLMLLGVKVLHGRAYHPQTQGKLERFHRTLSLEALQGNSFRNLDQCQMAFDEFRSCYNHVRPHQALEMAVPASRYQISSRAFPDRLPEPEYDETDAVRKVDVAGQVSYHGRVLDVPNALAGYYVGIRQSSEDSLQVRFCAQVIKQIDLRAKQGEKC